MPPTSLGRLFFVCFISPVKQRGIFEGAIYLQGGNKRAPIIT